MTEQKSVIPVQALARYWSPVSSGDAILDTFIKYGYDEAAYPLGTLLHLKRINPSCVFLPGLVSDRCWDERVTHMVFSGSFRAGMAPAWICTESGRGCSRDASLYK